MTLPKSDDFDRLFKIRSLLSHLQRKCNAISMDQMVCIDEQIILFKGSLSLKQCVLCKPHKYGYKVFVLCDSRRIIYDFQVYTGKISSPENFPDLLNIVLTLSAVIPQNKNLLLYFDNWFTSYPRVCELVKCKIYCLGTVRTNHLRGCNLLQDKELKHNGRGSFNKKVQMEGQPLEP